MNMKPTGKNRMKCTYLHFLYLFCAIKLMASDDLPSRTAFAPLPSSEQVTSIEIITPGHGWKIWIFPDGHVTAQWGVGSFDNMGMPPGTISFQRFCRLVLSSAEDAAPHSEADIPAFRKRTQIVFLTSGTDSFYAHYLRDDTLPRYLFPNNPSNWQTPEYPIAANANTISPLKLRVLDILPNSLLK
jgi:hypothetical protein